MWSRSGRGLHPSTQCRRIRLSRLPPRLTTVVRLHGLRRAGMPRFKVAASATATPWPRGCRSAMGALRHCVLQLRRHCGAPPSCSMATATTSPAPPRRREPPPPTLSPSLASRSSSINSREAPLSSSVGSAAVNQSWRGGHGEGGMAADTLRGHPAFGGCPCGGGRGETGGEREGAVGA